LAGVTAPAFSELVDRLIEAFGQRVGTVRNVPEGVLLKTSDGFLYAFYEDPTQLSLGHIIRLLAEMPAQPSRIVLFTPGRLPLALRAEVERQRATTVDGAVFQELVKGLDLGQFLGEEPRAEPPPGSRRLLPSAQLLDAQMRRAQTWLDWGVPALALRFFRQAAELKPEFLPARNGVARSLLGLGLVEDAQAAFAEVLEQHPNDFDARLGQGAVLGALGNINGEIAAYRALVEEQPEKLAARASLMAALVDGHRWAEAMTEIETMLRSTPEDPRLRFLYGVALEQTGATGPAARERERARRLGLAPETERALCLHLGLPVPRAEPVSAAAAARSAASTGKPTPPAAAVQSRTTKRSPRRRRKARARPAPAAPRRARARTRRRAGRKPK
jgi:tetratricopeptide (TPR) repeat protein